MLPRSVGWGRQSSEILVAPRSPPRVHGQPRRLQQVGIRRRRSSSWTFWHCVCFHLTSDLLLLSTEILSPIHLASLTDHPFLFTTPTYPGPRWISSPITAKHGSSLKPGDYVSFPHYIFWGKRPSHFTNVLFFYQAQYLIHRCCVILLIESFLYMKPTLFQYYAEN